MGFGVFCSRRVDVGKCTQSSKKRVKIAPYPSPPCLTLSTQKGPGRSTSTTRRNTWVPGTPVSDPKQLDRSRGRDHHGHTPTLGTLFPWATDGLGPPSLRVGRDGDSRTLTWWRPPISRRASLPPVSVWEQHQGYVDVACTLSQRDSC